MPHGVQKKISNMPAAKRAPRMTTMRDAATTAALSIGQRTTANPGKARAHLTQAHEDDEGMQQEEPRAKAFLGTTDDRASGGVVPRYRANQPHDMPREVFSKLDHSAVGSVTFGDGSVVSVQGCSSVAFIDKLGAHMVLMGVYYIPWLHDSMSMGQLDENGAAIHINRGIPCI